jgi:signal transduction histidine kinase
MMKTTGLFLQFIVLGLLSLPTSAFAAESEKEILSQARTLFAQKQFPQALALYDKIPVKSDRWLLALEEKAWAHMHLDQYDKAIAAAQTLTNPALNGLTSTEPFLLKALIQLKICDYVAVFQTLKDFKSQKRGQVEAIQQLAKTGHNAVSRGTLEKWILNPTDWKALGPNLALMPQLFYHDIVMLREAQKKNIPALEKRLRELAIADNNENYRILQKLNLIEVESVQRVHIASQFDRKQGEKIEKGDYDFTFKDDQEVWLDEIGSYQATINRCQKKSGRTM